MAPAAPIEMPEPLSTTARVHSGGEYNQIKKRLRKIETLLRDLREPTVQQHVRVECGAQETETRPYLGGSATLRAGGGGG